MGGHGDSGVRCADYAVLVAEDELWLQNLVDAVAVCSGRLGLELNCGRMNIVVVPGWGWVYVNGEILGRVDRYTCLGVVVVSDGGCICEITQGLPMQG